MTGTEGPERDREPKEPTEPNEPNGEEGWKAKYDELLGHSRDWEKRAKANKEAAEKLAALEQEKRTEAEKVEALKRQLDEKERAEARDALAAKVAKEKGVPVELISGDDEESMSAWADRLKAAFTPPPAARVDRPGSFDRGRGDGDPMRDVVRKMFGNQ